MHNLITRLTTLEHDRRAEATRLTDWLEAIILARTPALDPEIGPQVVAELCARDPALEGRLLAAYATLGYTARYAPDGTVAVRSPERRR